jgi:ABC-2 type transport system ATP-binding protein
MLQRTGLAAALVADPELLVLDEPMSGLDPGGRREVRDIIRSERSNGRTIFFSTHILADVPTICDHVAILQQGRVVVTGAIDELLHKETKRTDVSFVGDTAEFQAACERQGLVTRNDGRRLLVEVGGAASLSELLRAALDRGVGVLEVAPRYDSLEDLFVRAAPTDDKPI